MIYGNTASPIDPEKRPATVPPDHTHSWTIFVRDPTVANDLSIIKKVVFKLHDTIKNPLRTVEEPPFEITETGWGEFEVIIKVFFQPEANEKPVQFFHHLKLHPYNNLTGIAHKDGGVVENEGDTKDKTVKSILYDEFIFNEPTEDFFYMLTDKPGHLLQEKKSEENVFSEELEQEELFKINRALEKVENMVLKMEREKVKEES